MSHSLFVGAEQELLLASRLIGAGLIVSRPLIDIGVDLLVSNTEFSRTVPIQVKYKGVEKNIFFTGREIDSYGAKDVFIAYFLGRDEWFMPFSAFLKWAERPSGRADRGAYIKLNEVRGHLSEFSGKTGFENLIRHVMSTKANGS